MILEGSTIAGVGHARAFARHLYKAENEIIQVQESLSSSQSQPDFTNDLVDLQLLTNLTRGRTGLFHVAIAPRQYERMEEEQWQRSMELIAEEFRLQPQMRLVMFHQKAGRPHLHVFWSLVDAEREKLLSVKTYKRRLQRVASQLEREFGHELTPRRAGQRSLSISHRERMEKSLSGKDPKRRKELISRLWAEQTSVEGFQQQLKKVGYTLTQGDRCRYAVVDTDGTVYNLVRQLPKVVKLAQVEERLELHYHELASIAEVKRDLLLTQEQQQKTKQQELDRLVEQVQQQAERDRCQ